MDLSVIIVNWNTKNLLMECLGSLTHEASQYHSEIIVVDNASIDGSPEMVESNFPLVRLIRNDMNLGFAKANNIGIGLSTGRYVCLINSDAMVLKGCLKRMIAYMDKHHEIGMLGPKILNPDGTLQPSCMGLPTIWNTFCRSLGLDKLFPKSRFVGGRLMNYWPHNSIQRVEMLNGCFWLLRREAIEKVGLLDENFFFYGEDIDWCKRFRDAGWELVFYPEAEAIHYGGASSSKAPTKYYIEMQRADFQYWKKHHSKPAQVCFLLIIFFHQILRIIGYSLLNIVVPSKRMEIVAKIERSKKCILWLFNLERFSRNSI